MSRSEELKAYRARKKAEMGQAWLDEEARKRRDRRRRARPVQVPEPPEHKEPEIVSSTSLDAIFASKQAAATVKGHTIKKESVASALKRIKRIYKYKTSNDMTCFDWVRDTGSVAKFIETCDKWKSKESKLQQYQALASILKVFKDYQVEYKFYSNKSVAGRKQKDKIDDENKLTEKEKQNYLDWDKIVKLNKKDDLSPYDAAVIACYTLIPPRRAKDYGLMRLTTTDTDSGFNYLLLNARGKPSKLIFLNYKTDKQFGRQEFDVPRGLSARLQAHMTAAGLESGDFLFGKSKSEPYKSFSPQITKVFKAHTGKSISVNILRHSYISHFLKQERTLAERKATAAYMAHGLISQLKYNRI